MKTLIAPVALMGITVILATAIGNDDGAAILGAARGSVEISNEGIKIILGRVDEVSLPAVAGKARTQPIQVTYKSTVICEYRQRIPERSKIEVSGNYGGEGSYMTDIPLLEKNDVYLMVVRAKGGPGQVELAGWAYLPIGISSPCKIPPAEVPGIKAALLQLGASAQ